MKNIISDQILHHKMYSEIQKYNDDNVDSVNLIVESKENITC